MSKSAPVAVLLLVASIACSVRQSYRPPSPEIPAAWVEAAPAPADAKMLARWWDAFDDPMLTSLVERAIAGNLDVRTALSRVREARAGLASARSTLLPTADASGSARVAGLGDEGGLGGTTRSFSLGVDASWEIDAFGAVRSGIDASIATVGTREADLRDVLVSLIADVALDYIDARTTQARLEIALVNANVQEQTLQLTQFRAEAGLATDLDVQQALSNLETTRAQIASLDGLLPQATHRLALLLGLAPDALDAELETAAGIPGAPISVAVGVPADALRRRPDVRSAERQLAAQFALVNAARADLYPTFRLVGSIGLESLSLARLFVPGSSLWSASPSASLRIFDRRQIRQNLVIQSERQQQAALAYESRVLSALQEVEDTLTALAEEQSRRDHLAAAAAAAEQAADLSLQFYAAGLRDYRDVLDTQRSVLSLQDQLASSAATVSSNLVRLYRALGGGWAAESMIPEG